jgi:acyl-homoserine lactone acylase PvdQ
MQATRNEDNKDATRFIKKLQTTQNILINCIYILHEHGDILYFPGGGIMPARENHFIQGVYPKIGSDPRNKWQGRIPHEEMPYLINPKSGFIASHNNHMCSDKVKHGISQAFTYTGRKTRVTELLEDAIAKTGGKLTVRDMQLIQVDVLDVQARASLADMLYCVEHASIKLSPVQA